MSTARRDEYLTVAEIATELKLNQQTIRNWIERGQLRAVRLGARRVRVLRSELERYVAAGATGSDESEPSVAPVATEARDQVDQALGAARDALRAGRKADLAVALDALVHATAQFVQAVEAQKPGSTSDALQQPHPNARLHTGNWLQTTLSARRPRTIQQRRAPRAARPAIRRPTHCRTRPPRQSREGQRGFSSAGCRIAWKGVAAHHSGTVARLEQITRERAGPAGTTTRASARGVRAFSLRKMRRSRSVT